MADNNILSGFVSLFRSSKNGGELDVRVGKQLGEGTSKTCYELLNWMGRPNGKVC